MTDSWAHSLDGFGRRSVPVLSAFVLVLVSIAPLPIPDIGRIMPCFALMAVYCWTVWRGELMPYTAVFALGLFEDLLRGTPLGLSSFVLLIVQAVLRRQSELIYGRTFGVLWLGFAVTASVWSFFHWALNSALAGFSVNGLPAIFQCVLTVALFPIVARLLQLLQRATLRNA
ncbi:MAG: rod shape-determining protein MreD [Alphaproteobacteria bacterium]